MPVRGSSSTGAASRPAARATYTEPLQYVPPSGTFHLDLLTRLGSAFAFDDLEVVRAPFGDLTVSVVSPRTLYRMKRDTVRLKDKADAALLKERFGFEDD